MNGPGAGQVVRRSAAAVARATAVVALLAVADLAATAAAGPGRGVIASSLLGWLALEAVVLHPLRALRRQVEAVRRDGDLTRPVEVTPGPVRPVATAVARLLTSVHSVVGKVCFTSTLVTESAAGLSEAAGSVTDASARQKTAVDDARAALGELVAALDGVAGSAQEAAEQAELDADRSRAGAQRMMSARAQMAEIAQGVAETEAAMAALEERALQIGSIVDTITSIAEQTNLLSLNATIEAARAGESGRGFAVVATEVGSLAETTATSTREISSVISGVQADTQRVLALVTRTAELARSGAELTAEAAGTLDELQASAASTTRTVAAIRRAAAEQQQTGLALADQVAAMGDLAHGSAQRAGEVAGRAVGLDQLASNLTEIERVFTLGAAGERAAATHAAMPAIVADAAARIAALLEEALASGRLTVDDLFDTAYQPIPDTAPQKYHTRYDRLTDELFPAVQEAVLDSHPALVYAGAVDVNGYFPTHNLRFSRPLTGRPAVDMVGNRTKRIFDDPVGRRCGAHDLPFLVQTYRRDTGEVMHDISAPIVVGGRRWGGFRIGYQA